MPSRICQCLSKKSQAQIIYDDYNLSTHHTSPFNLLSPAPVAITPNIMVKHHTTPQGLYAFCCITDTWYPLCHQNRVMSSCIQAWVRKKLSLRFYRPPLCDSYYCPVLLLSPLCNVTGATEAPDAAMNIIRCALLLHRQLSDLSLTN